VRRHRVRVLRALLAVSRSCYPKGDERFGLRDRRRRPGGARRRRPAESASVGSSDVVFLATDAMGFAGLLVATPCCACAPTSARRARAPRPRAGGLHDGALVTSSFTVSWRCGPRGRGARRAPGVAGAHDRTRGRSSRVRSRVSPAPRGPALHGPRSDTFASTFYALTGYHACTCGGARELARHARREPLARPRPRGRRDLLALRRPGLDPDLLQRLPLPFDVSTVEDDLSDDTITAAPASPARRRRAWPPLSGAARPLRAHRARGGRRGPARRSRLPRHGPRRPVDDEGVSSSSPSCASAASRRDPLRGAAPLVLGRLPVVLMLESAFRAVPAMRRARRVSTAARAAALSASR